MATNPDAQVRKWLFSNPHPIWDTTIEQAMPRDALPARDDLGGGNDCPMRTLGHGLSPLLQATFSEEYLLPPSDESDDHRPVVEAVHDVKKFGSFGSRNSLLSEHLVLVPSPLSFVEHDDVFVRSCTWVLTVVSKELVNVLYERRNFVRAILPSTTGSLPVQYECLANDLYQRAVAREKDAGPFSTITE